MGIAFAAVVAVLAGAPLCAQTFHTVEIAGKRSIDENRGYGVKVVIEDTKDAGRVEPAEGGLAHFVRLSHTVDWMFYVEAQAGKAVGKYLLTVDGQAMVGRSSAYYLQLPEAAYRRMKREHRKLPGPFDPKSLPVHGSVLLLGGRFVGTGLEVAFRNIALQLEFKKGSGAAIGLEKISPTQVQVVVGPYDAVLSNMSLGLDLDLGVASLWLGSGEKKDRKSYRLLTAVFDLATEDGQAAFHYFFATGHMDRIAKRPGVVRFGEVRETEELDQWYSAVKAGIGGLKVSVGGVSDSLEGSRRSVRWMNGRRHLDREVRFDRKMLVERVAWEPGRPATSRYLVVLPDLALETASRFATLVDDTDWRPEDRGRDKPTHRHKRYDLRWELPPEGLAELKSRSARCFDSDDCKKRIMGYDPPPEGAHVPYGINYTMWDRDTKIEVLRQFSDPRHTGFDTWAPSRQLVPFLAIEPWLMEASLACLRAGAETGGGRPLPGRLLLVARD